MFLLYWQLGELFLVTRQNNNNNLKHNGLNFRVGISIKTKILLNALKKLVILCQQKLHMKPTTSLYSVIQQCQMH